MNRATRWVRQFLGPRHPDLFSAHIEDAVRRPPSDAAVLAALDRWHTEQQAVTKALQTHIEGVAP